MGSWGPELYGHRARSRVSRLAQEDARLRSAVGHQAFPTKSVLGMDENGKVSLVLTIAWNCTVMLSCALCVRRPKAILGYKVQLISRIRL
jgi:hypothetical protein